MELNPEKHQMTGPNYESTPRDFKPKKQLKAILERFLSQDVSILARSEVMPTGERWPSLSEIRALSRPL
jgi:hypothetical protein